MMTGDELKREADWWIKFYFPRFIAQVADYSLPHMAVMFSFLWNPNNKHRNFVMIKIYPFDTLETARERLLLAVEQFLKGRE